LSSVGNRASLTTGGTITTCPTMTGGTASTYAIASSANQINTITTGSNVRTFGYAASGQVTGDQRTSTSDYTFGYNNDGRLTSASLNSTSVGAYVYNGFEQRAVKTASGLTTNFVYDTAGHMIAEENGSTGAAIREYIWLDNLPVAMVDDTGSSPVIYYIHTDQLGTPQKISDGNANVVWDGVFDPFGNAVAVSGANWGTGIWKSFTWEPTTPEPTLLRFPGQYADVETALNQNGFRDYDPTIGRYVESDPIGLWGGVNTYAYVGGYPATRTDPEGKFGLPGAVVGAGLNFAIQFGTNYLSNGGDWGNALRCVNWSNVGASALAGAILPGLGGVAYEGYGALVGAGSSSEFGNAVEGYALGVAGKTFAGNALPVIRPFARPCECNYNSGAASQLQHLVY
jgi:RHS repeat-associated protein